MKYNHTLQIIVGIIVAIGIGCATPSTSTEGPAPEAAESSTPAAETATSSTTGLPQSDSFDQAEDSLFTVNAPNTLEGGMLSLQATQKETVLLSSLTDLPTTGYTASAKVIPPGVGEHVGIAFTYQNEKSRGFFYLYRPPGADRFGKLCNVGLDVLVGGRKIRNPTIQVREIAFQKDTPIKLTIRHTGQNVVLAINDKDIGRFHERSLKVGKVGVYGKSQHADGNDATVKFDSFDVE